MHVLSTRPTRAVLIGGVSAVTLSALAMLAVPSALAALATMKAMDLSRYTGALCHGKCGLVLIFEREIVVMLALCEVQIRRSSGNSIVKVGDVQHLRSVPLMSCELYP